MSSLSESESESESDSELLLLLSLAAGAGAGAASSELEPESEEESEEEESESLLESLEDLAASSSSRRVACGWRGETWQSEVNGVFPVLQCKQSACRRPLPALERIACTTYE